MAKYKFPENFTWGAATSGPQSEGWTDKKNFNIYDYWFQTEPEKFHNGVGPQVNCDTYRKYKEDVKLYLQILEDMLRNNEIDRKEYEELKEEALEVADKQMDKIEEEEKEQENEFDLDAEYENIMDSIKETRDSVVYNQIGENSYGILQNQYKNMTEVERKEVLLGTHTKICVDMDVKCDIDFTKYEIKTPNTVNKDGYCMMTTDVKGNQYPMEVMLFEQISKIYIKEIYNKEGYTPLQKERLALRVAENIDRQKQMILNNYKKRELDIYKG